MSHEEEIEYTDEFVSTIELVWGDGFLSPGGSEEIGLFLEGLDISGKNVLDVGCGVGGCDVVLVREFGAASVLGIDIEAPVLEQCVARAETEGLSDQLSYQKVDPGPFPLEDESFDVVFSKDAMIHIEDKHSLFKEVYRVLCPGGVFVASDWLRSDENEPSEIFQAWVDAVGLSFGLHSPPFYEDALEKAGFENIHTLNRNEFLVKVLTDDIEHMGGAGHDDLVRINGEDAEAMIVIWQNALEAAKIGELCPHHLRGFKPA